MTNLENFLNKKPDVNLDKYEKTYGTINIFNPDIVHPEDSFEPTIMKLIEKYGDNF